MKAIALATAIIAFSGAGSTHAADLDGPAMRALFRLSALKLKDIPSCRGVGLTAADRTLGDFLGSILSQFVSLKSDNPILQVHSLERTRADHLTLEITFHKKDGEEEWRWGVAFMLNQKTGQPLPSSVRCIVAG